MLMPYTKTPSTGNKSLQQKSKPTNQETFLVLRGYYFDLLSIVVIEYLNLRKEAVLCSWSEVEASQGTEQLRALRCFNSSQQMKGVDSGR